MHSSFIVPRFYDGIKFTFTMLENIRLSFNLTGGFLLGEIITNISETIFQLTIQ